MSARDLQHHTIEGAEIELVAAEHFWLGDAIETGSRERVVHRGRIGAALVRLVLLRAQRAAQRCRARNDFFGGQARFRDREGQAHRPRHYQHARHSSRRPETTLARNNSRFIVREA
jgi:hypothetical protein